ncbi:hypothetical protein [Synoicihabitans lomoniglobus]|uniref:Uncharacterized protein n=1 Tax=Synoicihabitans lomoniglobus TaxID=2909285 RepID=A0AAF0CNW2_9BACT|nr:hypothetical protein [Opitutaceae bacterium LMO-M01]WED64955.1 hypothetical protein PXH66_21620 [Opitutaceae bacterium LMO-M01]
MISSLVIAAAWGSLPGAAMAKPLVQTIDTQSSSSRAPAELAQISTRDQARVSREVLQPASTPAALTRSKPSLFQVVERDAIISRSTRPLSGLRQLGKVTSPRLLKTARPNPTALRFKKKRP